MSVGVLGGPTEELGPGRDDKVSQQRAVLGQRRRQFGQWWLQGKTVVRPFVVAGRRGVAAVHWPGAWKTVWPMEVARAAQRLAER
jgi:hypothetical protein